jgi:photosystem I reaction center subunit VIII
MIYLEIRNGMTAAFLPPILVPVVTLIFPGICFALFFVLIEQEEVI